MSTKIEVICDNCGKTFGKYKCDVSKHNFCDINCFKQYNEKKKKRCEVCGNPVPKSRSKNNKHFYCSRECYLIAHSSGDKNRICPNCGKHFIADRKERIYCSHKCYTSHREYSRGENHPSWKGGVSKLNDKKDSWDYKKWRKQVYERDYWTCQHCGYKGQEINAHHIYSWKYYPEKRYDIDNGITLCVSCHTKLHQLKGYDTDKPIEYDD